MTQTTGWGLIGTGRRARELMIPALLSSSSARLVGVCGREPERAREAVKEWPEVKVFSGIEALLADPAVQIVHVLSPHFLHVPHAAQAIDAGKHVLAESPLALSVDGAHKLVEKARNRNVKLGVAFPHRFHPALKQVRDQLREGAVGEIRHLEVFYSQLMDWPQGWWRDSGRSGPAALISFGATALDIAVWLKGAEAIEISAMGVDGDDPPVNQIVSMLLHFQDDTLGFALGASSFSESHHCAKVEGSRGRLELEGDFIGTRPLILVKRQNGQVAEQKIETCPAAALMIEAFSDAVRTGGDFHPDGLDGKRVVEITCAAIESMKAKRAVRVGEVSRLV